MVYKDGICGNAIGITNFTADQWLHIPKSRIVLQKQSDEYRIWYNCLIIDGSIPIDGIIFHQLIFKYKNTKYDLRNIRMYK